MADCNLCTHRSEEDTCDTWTDKFDGPAILTFPPTLCKLDSLLKYIIYILYMFVRAFGIIYVEREILSENIVSRES